MCVRFIGLHLVTWGEVDPKSDTIAMWLGFPATSLAKLGLHGLPRDAVLPIAVRGSLHKPSVDWRECAAAHTMRIALPVMQYCNSPWWVAQPACRPGMLLISSACTHAARKKLHNKH